MSTTTPLYMAGDTFDVTVELSNPIGTDILDAEISSFFLGLDAAGSLVRGDKGLDNLFTVYMTSFLGLQDECELRILAVVTGHADAPEFPSELMGHAKVLFDAFAVACDDYPEEKEQWAAELRKNVLFSFSLSREL